MLSPHQPTWAIADLVFSVIGHTRQARRDLIGRLGYANKGKAAARFDAMIRTGDIDPYFRQALSRALNIDPSLVRAALAETEIQQARYAKVLDAHREASDRDLFAPGIHIKMDISKRKVSLGILVLCGYPGVREIAVPAYVPTLPERVQLAVVRGLIEEFPATRTGKRYHMLYADPTGYLYCPTYDEAWELSPTFQLMRKYTGPVAPGGGGVGIANKWIRGDGRVMSSRPF